MLLQVLQNWVRLWNELVQTYCACHIELLFKLGGTSLFLLMNMFVLPSDRRDAGVTVLICCMLWCCHQSDGMHLAIATKKRFWQPFNSRVFSILVIPRRRLLLAPDHPYPPKPSTLIISNQTVCQDWRWQGLPKRWFGVPCCPSTSEGELIASTLWPCKRLMASGRPT